MSNPLAIEDAYDDLEWERRLMTVPRRIVYTAAAYGYTIKFSTNRKGGDVHLLVTTDSTILCHVSEATSHPIAQRLPHIARSIAGKLLARDRSVQWLMKRLERAQAA